MTSFNDTFHERITVVVADDHRLALQELVRAVSKRPELELVAQARDGDAALAAIEELIPDVALIDVRMPGLDGIELCARLAARQPPCRTRVALLTAFPTNGLRDLAMSAGAVAFLDKEVPRRELCDVLVAAART